MIFFFSANIPFFTYCTSFYLTNFVTIDMKERKKEKASFSFIKCFFQSKIQIWNYPLPQYIKWKIMKAKNFKKEKDLCAALIQIRPWQQFSRQYLRQPNQNYFWRLSYCFCKLIKVRNNFEYFYEENSETDFTGMSVKLSQRVKETNSLQDKCSVVGTRIKCKPCSAAWFPDLIWSPFY